MRVVTWNVWWRFGPWRQRREAILAVLAELRPDVVGLQEVWADGDDNLAGWLADRLGMRWTWAASDTPDRWRGQAGETTAEVGNAVLSRWPIVDRAVLRLPAEGGRDDGRLVLHTLLDGPEHRLPFFTTHLNPGLGESATRCGQVAALARFVAAQRGEGPLPPVVTGDHNAWPDSDEMRLLGGYRTAPVVPGQVLVDTWEFADPSAPAATWLASNPYVPRSFALDLRCDYIHLGQGPGTVRSVRRAGDGPVGGVWPSDHTAVVADLDFDAPA
ncbi:endonuclease/exonuclease/phosphatase family protein [Streptomyces albipurpureus]|uniref:Endonuclease/exonuclease/phosphatase family protein n=1 Tax=Streptomyces albipurpureus TaxID=2897419 RepID=A0ABT0UQP9_9ACTN|nr:endonuclease/exonuclease/phosphatase family protein [Streptomyces sp. CWNU-1]MCM2390691.1 endonuclease/exonuclease/phosphatase family protein [Streptomyces sp. CWNU-1]